MRTKSQEDKPEEEGREWSMVKGSCLFIHIQMPRDVILELDVDSLIIQDKFMLHGHEKKLAN